MIRINEEKTHKTIWQDSLAIRISDSDFPYVADLISRLVWLSRKCYDEIKHIEEFGAEYHETKGETYKVGINYGNKIYIKQLSTRVTIIENVDNWNNVLKQMGYEFNGESNPPIL